MRWGDGAETARRPSAASIAGSWLAQQGDRGMRCGNFLPTSQGGCDAAVAQQPRRRKDARRSTSKAARPPLPPALAGIVGPAPRLPPAPAAPPRSPEAPLDAAPLSARGRRHTLPAEQGGRRPQPQDSSDRATHWGCPPPPASPRPARPSSSASSSWPLSGGPRGASCPPQPRDSGRESRAEAPPSPPSPPQPLASRRGPLGEEEKEVVAFLEAASVKGADALRRAVKQLLLRWHPDKALLRSSDPSAVREESARVARVFCFLLEERERLGV